MGIVGLYERIKNAVGNADAEIGDLRIRVAVRQFNGEHDVTEICDEAGLGCGGNEASALVQRDVVDVLMAGHVQGHVRDDVTGNGDHIGIIRTFLQGDG